MKLQRITEKLKASKKLKIGVITGGVAFIAIVIALVVIITDGNNKPVNGGQQPTKAVTPEPTVTPESTTTNTPTPIPTVNPLKNMGSSNPLEIEGYEYYETGVELNKDGDVYMKAYVPYTAKIGDGQVSLINIYDCDEEGVFFDYVLTTQGNSEEEWDQSYSADLHVGYMDSKTLEVDEEIYDFGVTYSTYVGDKVNVSTLEQDTRVNVSYDKSMTPTETVIISGGDSLSYSYDGQRAYYTQNNKLYMVEQGHMAEQIVLTDNVAAQYVTGVITVDGIDYVSAVCQAGDMAFYTVIFDVSSGSSEYVNNNVDSFIGIYNNVYVETVYDEEFNENLFVIAGEGTCRDYSWEGNTVPPMLMVMNDGNLMFSSFNGETNSLYMYDEKTGELIDSVEFTIDYEEGQEYYEEFGIYLMQNFVYLTDNRLLLQFSDCSGSMYYCIWQIDGEPGIALKMSVNDHVEGSRPTLELPDGVDFEAYTSGPVSKELEPLKEVADGLEDKYGVEIYIGEECADIIGGYAINPLVDYQTVEEALDILDEELAKYPAGFFEQLLSDYMTENAFYVAGTLMAVEDGLLDTAGGFRTTEGERQVMVLDCTFPHSVAGTLHHELSHSIDDYLISKSMIDDVEYLSGEKWEELNPVAGCYTYDYSQFGYEEYWNYSYEECYFGDEDVSGTYFVDTYSMTFPTEDRARIWEYVMQDDSYVDFSEAPYLEAKLNYYAEAIRAGFDTEGWSEEMLWEAR